MSIKTIEFNKTLYSSLFPEKKCKYSWFKADKVYVYNEACDGVWYKGMQIGEPSANGKVYLGCCDKECKYIIK